MKNCNLIFICFILYPFLGGCALFQDPLLEQSLLAEMKGMDEAKVKENYGVPHQSCVYKKTGTHRLLYQRFGARGRATEEFAQAITQKGKQRWGYEQKVKENSQTTANCWFFAFFNSNGQLTSITTNEAKTDDCAYLGEEPVRGWRKKSNIDAH